MGCSWFTYVNTGSGHIYYGGIHRGAPGGFDSGDAASAVVDRTHCEDDGVVRFRRNWKALEYKGKEAESIPIGFPEEAVLLVSFAAFSS